MSTASLTDKLYQIDGKIEKYNSGICIGFNMGNGIIELLHIIAGALPS